MNPEAKLSPPPTRSKISIEERSGASKNWPSYQQRAPQSLNDAERTVRSVVAVAAKFGNVCVACSIIRL